MNCLCCNSPIPPQTWIGKARLTCSDACRLERKRAAGRANSRKRYWENHEKALAKVREMRTDPAVQAREREYKRTYDKDPVKKAERRERITRRYHNDPSFRISCNLRSRMQKAMSRCVKAASAKTLLGCTIEELRSHIAAKFQPGMSWENYRYEVWHIDHIKPVAFFDMTDPEQQRACFHYTNLQPLWAADNFRKAKSPRNS